jgi:cation diffusion facilitator CzcD-associated flavoprotein CzcO
MSGHDVIIIGAGFSGIGVAIKLDRAGFGDFVVLEEGEEVGGAWYWNTYPGVAVDIPSFSYQFSFAARSDWSRVYAPGRELKSYAENLVDTYGLRDRLRLGAKVVAIVFDEARDLWRVRTSDGAERTARHVVVATGVLTRPKIPAIPGLADFAGTTMHTARWDHGLDLRGKRVAIIGTGASALQVIPEIAPDVDRLVVCQRTPIWCMPKLDIALTRPVQFVLEHVPGARRLVRLVSQTLVEAGFPVVAHFHRPLGLARVAERVGRRFLRRQVEDPVVRDKLTPRYALGCKRPSFSNDYLRTFNRDNVVLETEDIEAITRTGVRTADGVEHQVDVLILATGFKVFERDNMPSFQVTGVGGRDLAAWWDEHRLQAYQGVSVPRFPNLYSILGPYGYNGSSYFNLIEIQARHILRCLGHARRTGATRVEVTERANSRYHRDMLARRPRQVFFQDSCAVANSYYFDRHGDVALRPSLTLEMMWTSATFDLDDYAFTAQ